MENNFTGAMNEPTGTCMQTQGKMTAQNGRIDFQAPAAGYPVAKFVGRHV